jgi:hypothetical protein
MITVKADFNHRDGRGRLILSDLDMHKRTPFAEIAGSGERIVFVQGEDVVEGILVLDGKHGWVGDVDWESQGVLKSYPDGAVATV